MSLPSGHYCLKPACASSTSLWLPGPSVWPFFPSAPLCRSFAAPAANSACDSVPLLSLSLNASIVQPARPGPVVPLPAPSRSSNLIPDLVTSWKLPKSLLAEVCPKLGIVMWNSSSGKGADWVHPACCTSRTVRLPGGVTENDQNPLASVVVKASFVSSTLLLLASM